MKVPFFRAKDKDSDNIVEGFYFNYPVAAGMCVPQGGEDAMLSSVLHCIATYKPAMMGIVNEPTGCTIDINTLEFVKFVEIPCKADTFIP